MINKETFVKLFQNAFQCQQIENDLEKITKNAIYDWPYIDNMWQIFEALIKQIVNPDYIDLVFEYLYPDDFQISMIDRPENPLIFEENGEEISISTPEDLFNYLLKNNGLNSNYRIG